MKRSISLPPEQDAFIQQQVASGRYASASEVVREALRALEARADNGPSDRARLQSDIQEGLDSLARGEGRPIDEAFADIERAIRKAKAKIAKSGG